MGVIIHHVIVVTGGIDFPELREAHAKAKELLPGLVSEIVHGRANGYSSFLVAPDGSKEGWRGSNEADTQRDQFVNWIKEHRGLDWFVVRFGGDSHETYVEDHK